MAVAAEAALPEPFRRMAGLWWVWIATGIAWIVVALVVLQFESASVNTVGVVIGLMFLAAGAQNLGYAWLATGASKWLMWIFGVLFLIAGVIALIRPAATFAGVADILGFLFLVAGLSWLIQALAERETNDFWWFGLVAGLATIVVAFWTAGQLLIDKHYILLIFSGIWALFHGVGDLVTAFRIKEAGPVTPTR